MLRSYFLSNSTRDRTLHHFISQGTYDFCIGAGTDTVQLDDWSQIHGGDQIIMRIILDQIVDNDQHRCPRPDCEMWNDGKKSKNGWIDW